MVKIKFYLEQDLSMKENKMLKIVKNLQPQLPLKYSNHINFLSFGSG